MTTTFRNAVFQLHWFFGITAGIVLAIVGVTGGILSFEDELLKALNPGVMTVQPRGEALPPGALVARVQEQRPGEEIASLQLSADPRDAVVVGLAPKDGGRRGPRLHADPYTGELLGEPRHQEFFRTTMRLHRWLVADDVGKQIVGASTVILVFFCLSGLYLRWPRRWGSLRTWFALDWRQKGRNFLWHLHSVVGTWVLLTYLVMSLTGLWWSYGWYREAVNNWAAAGAPRGERLAQADAADRGAPPPFDFDTTWRAFERAAPAWSSATLSVPKGDKPASVRYLDADPAHERARNELAFDRWTLEPVKHERYDDGSWRQKIGASMFALHRGSFFGTGGVVVFMLTSFAMPLFAITGWMLYLDRRRRKRAVRTAAAGTSDTLPQAAPQPAGPAPVLVLHASQTGTAEALALRTAGTLREAGCPAEARALGTIAPADLALHPRLLFVVATYGDGEAPDPARAFARKLRDAAPALHGLEYGVLALGDSDYGDSFCGFGRELDQRLRHAGARPLFDRVDVDNEDPAALRHWQHQLTLLGDRTDIPDWRPPEYRRWRLVERRLLNPGSAGGEAWHLALVPEDPADLHWEAGDVAEIGPRPVAADDPAATPLPSREYSIASVPGDGSLQLIVRRMFRPDGRPGLGSGWLLDGVEVGGCVDLRVRPNPGFHVPADDRPVLMVGNGTGLAGLRALLKARIASGHARNWLLYGERSAAHDRFHIDELQAWQQGGALQRLDLVFSRDQPQRRYVQHVLEEAAEQVRRWVGDGAAIYVCGSLRGMAPGVDTVLERILGRDALEAMAADGRYRRDVY
jgi:sulfite reductase (NADPH) flavoprotein alpha-component